MHGTPSAGAGGCRFVTLAEARSVLGSAAKEVAYSSTTCVYRDDSAAESRSITFELATLRQKTFENVAQYVEAHAERDERIDGIGEAAYLEARPARLTFVSGFLHLAFEVRLDEDTDAERAALVSLAKAAAGRL